MRYVNIVVQSFCEHQGSSLCVDSKHGEISVCVYRLFNTHTYEPAWKEFVKALLCSRETFDSSLVRKCVFFFLSVCVVLMFLTQINLP